jgi:hypothetical protein
LSTRIVSSQERSPVLLRSLIDDLKAIAACPFPQTAFVLMFSGVVIAPLLLFVIAGQTMIPLSQLSLGWYLLAVTTLIFVSISVGILLFRRHQMPGLTISPKRR